MGRYDPYEEKKPAGAIIGVIFCLLVAGGGWFYWQASETAATSGSQSLSLPVFGDANRSDGAADENLTADAQQADASSLAEIALPEPAFLLPELSNSDQAFRDAIAGVSAQLAPWFQADQVIRKYMVMANDFSQGLLLEKHMRFLKHSQPFEVEKTANGLLLSPKGYARYDSLAAAVDAMDERAALKVYKQFRPLLMQVFESFGYPADRSLDDLFLKAAAQILAAPAIKEPIALKKHAVIYQYADAKLESLSPVSKQMLRMGPDNTRIIQNKVRQLVEVLVNNRE